MSRAATEESETWEPRQRAALLSEGLDQVLKEIKGTKKRDLRDRALLLFGFNAGGRRRSEIAGAVWENLKKVSDGYIYTLKRHKGQRKHRRPILLPVRGKAAEAMEAWIKEGGITEGPLFRYIDRHGNVTARGLSGQGVEHIVKTRFEKAGFTGGDWGPHSLRAGFMTQAGLNRVSLPEAMYMSGHSSHEVASSYFRVGDVMHSQAGDVYGMRPGQASFAMDLFEVATEVFPEWDEERRLSFLRKHERRLHRAVKRLMGEIAEEEG